jgi:hypothetical protein
LKSYGNLKECEMGYFSMVGEKIGGKVAGRKKKGPKSELGWWRGGGCKYEGKIKIDEKNVDSLNEIRPHMNVKNEAYHMHKIMFMEKIEHNYTIVQKP